MDHSSTTKILKQLARTAGEPADKALKKEASKIAANLENETRFDLLKQQIELLDIIAFRVPRTAVEIVQRFIGRLGELELTHDDQVVLFRNELTKYDNKTKLVVEVLKLLDRIRYHRLEDILEIFMSQSRNEDAEVRKQADQGLEHLAEYNIDIYYSGKNRAGLGPAPQLHILTCLEALDADELQRNFSAITNLCRQLLSPSMGSTTWDYKSVTWSSAPIPATDYIKDIRRRSMQLLMRLYRIAATTVEKILALSALLDATRAPHKGQYGEDVLQMISDDTLEVLTFFKELLRDENLQIVQKIEHDAYWRFRHAPSADVKAGALEIRDLLAKHYDYTIYKDLIGFEGIFKDWEESLAEEPEFRDEEEYRTARAKEYAEAINADNWSDWRGRILKFVKTESNDLATFPHFYEFLRHFAETSPDLAFTLLTENLDDIRLFTIPLLRGLWEGPRRADLRKLMLEWIAADEQLLAITKLFISNDDVDLELLHVLLDKGAKDANRDILNMIATVAVSNYVDGRKDLVPKFLLPAVQSLSKMGDASWINELWYRKVLSDILHGLGEEDREIILNGMLVARDIEYHAEELLVPLAKDNPARIIAFFGERLQHEAEVKPGQRYDAIPFQFHKLHETLADFPESIVDTVRQWFEGDGPSFQYHGANLLKIIFPDFSKPFEAKLLQLVDTGEREDIEFVLSVLRNYEGQLFLHNICKAIVARLPENDDLLTDVATVLESTGVVMGEFGFAEAYERKIEEIKPWLTDEIDRVRKFSTAYVTNLAKRAASERRRAEEEIELRKHLYGVRRADAGEEDVVAEQEKSVNEDSGQKE
ncbi:MAG: hypothetical protein MN733_31985 [Nitrososphaera sp.]|nr:hypothetical protein [Nitrososphaera sp.]